MVDSGRFTPGPDIPWLEDGVPPIALAPCPDGWREVTGGEVIECDPYPAEGADSCGAGEAHFPGESGCRPIGDACPAGDYAATLPGDGVVLYVKAGAPAGGDGTLASPYAALSEVSWVSLAAGTTVALAGGSYEGTLPLKAGVHVVGKCVAETLVTGITAPVASVVTVTSAGAPAAVRNVSISHSAQRGVWVPPGRALTLDGVLIEQSHVIGVDASGDGTAVTLSNVVIRDTRPDVSDGSYGRGINVTGGAEVDAVRLIVAANHEIGIGVFGTRSAARLRDTVVRDTRRSTPGGAGRGINVEDGARLEATRLLVVGSHDAGILGGADGASLVLTDTVVRDTLTTESSVTVTSGILLHGRASMVATRLLVANNHDIGIAVESEGSAVTLTDAVIRDTHHREGTDGVGGLLVQGGSVDATRLLIVRSHTMGVSAFIGGAIALTDTAVRDTAPPTDDGTLSRGINIQGPVQFNGNRVVIEGAKLGLVALSSAMGTIRDVSITRIAPPRICGTATCPDERGGHGVVVAGAALDMTAFEVRDAAICGVFLSPELETTDSSSLDLESGDISGSEIGACVQVSGYDLDRLTHRVEYRDNGTNLDTTTLPVPAPVIEHVSGR